MKELMNLLLWMGLGSERERIVGVVVGYETPSSFSKLMHCVQWIGPSSQSWFCSFLAVWFWMNKPP